MKIKRMTLLVGALIIPAFMLAGCASDIETERTKLPYIDKTEMEQQKEEMEKAKEKENQEK